MRFIINTLSKLLAAANKTAIAAAALVTLAVAAIGTIDVLTTKVLGQAVPGAFELSEAGLVLLVFLGIAVASRNRDHITVDIVINRLPHRVQQICRAFGFLATSLFFLLWTQQLWYLAAKSISISERAAGLFPFPLYPVKIAALAGMALASIEMIRRFLHSCRNIFRPRAEDPDEGLI